jgi:16S rRNA (cytosine1402-N4)-methyltransferase
MYHDPVMLLESVKGLNIRPEGVYVDATFGGGGHSKEILKHLINGKLIAFDQDEDAEKNKIVDNKFLFVRHNFRYIKNFLRYHGIQEVDGLIADLGVSSHQFDEPQRGFSFRSEGELDMRMNRVSDKNARSILNSYDEKRLTNIFKQYGELPNAYKLASLIISRRKEEEIITINQFTETIESCIPKHGENKFLAQVFQAIRIEVNDELESLKVLLQETTHLIKENGRMVVITYHSLEDRLVKNFFRSGNFEGKLEKDFFGNIKAPFRAINKNVIVPSDEELLRNNRARSAKMRIAEKGA